MSGAERPDDPPNIERARIREEERAKLAQEFADQDELAGKHDARIRALLVSFTLLAALLVPLAGAILGAAIRVFRLAAGF